MKITEKFLPPPPPPPRPERFFTLEVSEVEFVVLRRAMGHTSGGGINQSIFDALIVYEDKHGLRF